MKFGFILAILAGLLFAQTGAITVTPPSGTRGGVIRANAGRTQMIFTGMGNPATALTINVNLAPPCPEVKPPAPVATAAQSKGKSTGQPTPRNMVHEYNMYFTPDQVYTTGQNCGPDSVTATFRRAHTGGGIFYDVAATPGGGMTAHVAGSL